MRMRNYYALDKMFMKLYEINKLLCTTLSDKNMTSSTVKKNLYIFSYRPAVESLI